MRFSILAFATLLGANAFGDTAFITKKSSGSAYEIRLEGDYGGVTHSLFNFIEYYHSTPLHQSSKTQYSGKDFTIKTWTKDPEDMHGDAYEFTAKFDGKVNRLDIKADRLMIEGQIAETLIAGMWRMFMDYEDNFTFTRSRHFGDITMVDLFSNDITCEIAHRPQVNSHLVEKFARCTLADLRIK